MQFLRDHLSILFLHCIGDTQLMWIHIIPVATVYELSLMITELISAMNSLTLAAFPLNQAGHAVMHDITPILRMVQCNHHLMYAERFLISPALTPLFILLRANLKTPVSS